MDNELVELVSWLVDCQTHLMVSLDSKPYLKASNIFVLKCKSLNFFINVI